MIRPFSYRIALAFTSIAIAGLLAFNSLAAEPKVLHFEDQAGTKLYLHDFKGKVVLLNLWATWCAPCIKEMPSLAQLQEKYKSQGLVVLPLSEDKSLKKVTEFYAKKSIISLPTLKDPDGLILLAVKGKGLPTTLLIDRQGNAVKTIEGPMDWNSPEIDAEIQTLLKQ